MTHAKDDSSDGNGISVAEQRGPLLALHLTEIISFGGVVLQIVTDWYLSPLEP